jgi:hypothetical protein
LRWYPDAVLEVDLDRVTELSEDRERLWVMVEGADFLTLDEKREMVGLEALAGLEVMAGRDAVVIVRRSQLGSPSQPSTYIIKPHGKK